MFEEIKRHNALVRDQIYKVFVGGEQLLEKAHQVGDIHPNGKLVWTEYATGKFDWRAKKPASTPAQAPASKQDGEQDPRTDNYKTASEKTGERNPGRANYGWKLSAAGYDARELDGEEE